MSGIKNFYHCSLDDLVYFDVNENGISKILDLKLRESVKKDLDYMVKNNIDIISIEDSDYPLKLKNIDDMPITIYVRGDKKILNNIAVRNSWL